MLFMNYSGFVIFVFLAVLVNDMSKDDSKIHINIFFLLFMSNFKVSGLE